MHVAHAAFTEICHQVQCNIERTNKSQPRLRIAKGGNTVNAACKTFVSTPMSSLCPVLILNWKLDEKFEAVRVLTFRLKTPTFSC